MARKNKNAFAMSNRRRSTLLALCLLVAIAVIWLDHGPIGCYRQTQPKSGKQTNNYDFEKYHKKTFTVVKVVDGDTIDIDIPDGKYNHTRIRLWGVDTPETKHPNIGVMYFGPEASDFTTKSALGKQVTIFLDEADTRDKYNRLLAYVKLPDGQFLNEALLSEGLAYADTRFDHSFYHKYQRLEAVARSQKKGLWKEVTRDQLPGWLRRKKPKLLFLMPHKLIF